MPVMPQDPPSGHWVLNGHEFKSDSDWKQNLGPGFCSLCALRRAGLVGIPIQEMIPRVEAARDKMRQFDTGATRDTDSTKPDYEGFLSPLVIERFGEYMNENRTTALGVRDSDNWQKGIPLTAYIKSLFRHFMALWLWHRGYGSQDKKTLERALCGILFNAQGYLHEHLKSNPIDPVPTPTPRPFPHYDPSRYSYDAQLRKGQVSSPPTEDDIADAMERTHSG